MDNMKRGRKDTNVTEASGDIFLQNSNIEDLLESMDEIQELLKIFYKFFMGPRNKPRPSNEDNQPKYYKNIYY